MALGKRIEVLEKNVQLAMANAVGPEVQIVDYKLRPYSEVKEGYVAVHYALAVNYKLPNNAQVQVYHFFLKTAHSLDVENAEALVFQDSLPFPREVNFFNKIIPSMLKHLKGDSFAPKCWLAMKDMLFFEDLGLIGYSTSKLKVQDYSSLKCLTSTLGRFHASSLLAEAELGKPLNQVDPEIFEDVMFLQDKTFLGGFLNTTLTMVADLVKLFGFKSPNIDKLRDFLIAAAKPSPNKINVINHGDLWKNNYMLNAGNPQKCILVDYQCLRYASPVIDLKMMLYINCTPEQRKMHERELIEHYHSEFCTTLEQSDLSLRIPEFEEIWKTYEEYKLFGVTFAAMYLPGLLMPESVLGKILGDPVSFKRYVFENRSEFVVPLVNSNPEYGSAIKEIIRDLVEVAT
ncbi:uncharacterized protein LOC103316644 [Nasonia vitripennis]|uniref:CHK kinase-like domain-containing protein n=1 Tax=Nasonia vitripennis TaxID=7425 RepID=A0A7M7HCE7_NASVI|nr:uncharacterized protein LOC103316644 [Nasonia vitripennis]